ncbi:MAG: septal ring lytic transglycosylase RlpA family protein [Nitrospirae bacterium]|nr:septal ring lytic transglycosylase RlpA family protein [Nitrospirota bacterium]
MKQSTPLFNRGYTFNVLVVSFVLILVVGLPAAPSEARKAEARKYAAASWFGKEYHGRRTSSGVIYDMNSSQAAHKTLPFGTNLRVTNPKNGKSTRVNITDRGPFVKSRDIDVSFKCAKDLGIVNKGVSLVTIDYILKDGSKTRYVDITDMKTLPYRLSKIAFVDYKNAVLMKRMLTGSQLKNAYIAKSKDSGQTVYTVSNRKDIRPLAQNARLTNHKVQQKDVMLAALRAKLNKSKAANMVALMSVYNIRSARPLAGLSVPVAFMPSDYMASSGQNS